MLRKLTALKLPRSGLGVADGGSRFCARDASNNVLVAYDNRRATEATRVRAF